MSLSNLSSTQQPEERPDDRVSPTQGLLSQAQLAAIEPLTLKLKEILARASISLVEAGFLLLKAKEILGYGHFRSWLGQNFSLSAKTANRFMSVAQMVQQLQLDDQMVSRMLSLNMKTLYELAAKSTPKEIKTQVFSELQAGHDVSLAQVRRMKDTVVPFTEKKSENAFYINGKRLQEIGFWLEHHHAALESDRKLRKDLKTRLQAQLIMLKDTVKLLEERAYTPIEASLTLYLPSRPEQVRETLEPDSESPTLHKPSSDGGG
ncbi:MAG: DUF3102 domain-containing protein [Candidatus Sericytochromatia bacterium]